MADKKKETETESKPKPSKDYRDKMKEKKTLRAQRVHIRK
jgi:hypothetical protein